MRSVRTAVGAIGAGLWLLVPAMAADATPTNGADTAQAERQAGTEEFVVAFDQAASDAAFQSITDAGGSVVDVNAAAGLALVSAGETFISDVSGDAGVEGAARNHSIGTTQPGQPHQVASDRMTVQDEAVGAQAAGSAARGQGPGRGAEPLSGHQWDMAMIGATPDGAHRRATGRGVTVGIIDTGIDASHPDLAANFSHEMSRNFTMDIPAVDGPCEYETCIDPADVDHGGHGTHVAGSVAAARNGIGIAGVAPDATLVNLRAGQDSGYFFVYETVAALTEAGNLGLDVANMSFFTDPWLYNCESIDDYISGQEETTEEEIAEQAFIRETVLAATEYAHDAGVTLVAAAGNSHFNLALEERPDNISPDYPGGTEDDRVVTRNCLDLPSEAPDVISVSAVGPSTTKSDYSNYGFRIDDQVVEVSAPGGWSRDAVMPFPSNLILSTYPYELALAEGAITEDGQPTSAFTMTDCSVSPCAVYEYLQGTSMASPHAAGVAALIVEAHGRGNRHDRHLAPATVRSIMETSATDHACPAGGTEIYTDELRPASWNAVCEGTTADNGLYGEGIVSATAAVARQRR